MRTNEHTYVKEPMNDTDLTPFTENMLKIITKPDEKIQNNFGKTIWGIIQMPLGLVMTF